VAVVFLAVPNPESMLRKAVIVAGAAGPTRRSRRCCPGTAFAPPMAAPTLAQALVRVRAEQVDLLIVPLQASGNDIAALEREIPRLPGTFVIGTSPDADPSLILRAMRAGVHEFLVYPPTADDLAAAVDRMVRRSQPATGKRATFAVYSAKGGVGTTSVALNLAYALGRNEPGANVVLADFVVSGGDVAVMLDQRPSYDVGDLALKLGQVDGALLDSLLARTKSGCRCSPPRSASRPWSSWTATPRPPSSRRSAPTSPIRWWTASTTPPTAR
jgi:DNA-binding response OmpR family regulator